MSKFFSGRIVLRVASAVVLTFLTTSNALPQAVSQISGVVHDSSGAVVPSVDVTLTRTDTGVKRSTTTDENGAYTFPNLPIGPYRLEASHPGFRTFAQTGIELQVDSTPVIP